MTSFDVDASRLAGLGVSDWEPLAAFRTRQGKQVRYTFAVPLAYLTRAVRRPDPNEPFPGNRKVELPRARAFAEYLRGNATGSHGWTFPPIQLRTTEDRLREKAVLSESVGLVEIEVPRSSNWDIQDGQHRVLGVYVLKERIEKDIATLEARVAKKGRDEEASRELRALRHARKAILEESRVEVVLVVTDDRTHGQMFADIASHAKGINPDFATMLDKRDVVHRIAGDIIETSAHLSALVSSGQRGRLSTASPELLGAKNVADICHAVIVGPGRVGKKVRADIEEDEALWRERVREFFDSLFNSIPDLQRLHNGEITAPDLREQSLIASSTMWRALAIAWHEILYGENRLAVADYERFLGSIEPHLRCFTHVESTDPRTGELTARFGVSEGHPLWGPTGKFRAGARTPEGRHSDVNDLGRIFATWARQGLPLERAA